ncbi:MAG: hypothetical protein WKF68_14720 [Daejeonella sp.]
MAKAGDCGINVSKTIKELGGESLTIFPSGGLNGKLLEEYLDARQFKYKAVCETVGTRESFSVTKTATNSQYRFAMPGYLKDKNITIPDDAYSSQAETVVFIIIDEKLAGYIALADEIRPEPAWAQVLRYAAQTTLPGHRPG